MKLRILGDSIRLRLGRAEVERFGAGDVVEETTHFGIETSAHLRYSVRLDPAGGEVRARYLGGAIEVYVPADAGRAWAAGTDVSIAARQTVGDRDLCILIEKDFRCLTPRGDQDDDAFPNPGDSC